MSNLDLDAIEREAKAQAMFSNGVVLALVARCRRAEAALGHYSIAATAASEERKRSDKRIAELEGALRDVMQEGVVADSDLERQVYRLLGESDE